MLEINNLHLSRGEEDILKGVTFDIRLNHIVGIYGVASSGKTSIVEAILNFIEFSQGTIIYENKKVAYNIPKHIAKLRKEIGYLPQKDYFLKSGKILENIQWIGGISKESVIELANLVEIVDSLYLNIDELTGYEKLKFKLALSLVKEPQILFIDEPLANISPKYVDEFLELVEKVAKMKKVGVLILSQYEKLFKNGLFDKVYRLEDGVLYGV